MMERASGHVGGGNDRLFTLLARSQLVWFVAAALVWSIALLTRSLDPDYTSGELLDHLQSWQESGMLYPALGAAPPFRVLNYPPLVLFLARTIAALGVPALAAGRLVNAIGFLLLVGAVTWWVRQRGARGTAVIGTVGLLGASAPLLYGAGQFHVELWAAAGTVWGFALLDRASSWRGAALGGFALALACLAKQTQVVPSVVAVAWVWTHRRQVAPAATGVLIVSGVAGAAGITAAFGAEAWRHLLTYTVGSYSAANLAEQLFTHVASWLILLAVVGRAAWSNASRSRNDPALWYWLGALIWCVSSARAGASYPYFLDLHIATIVLAGPIAFGAAAVGSRLWRGLLAVQIIAGDIGAGATLALAYSRVQRTESELPALCALLRGEQRVLAEEAGVVRACGHAALIDPFIMTSLAEQHRWDPAPFEAALRAGEYRVVVLPFDPRLPVEGVNAERWTTGELAAFRTARIIKAAPTGRWIARW